MTPLDQHIQSFQWYWTQFTFAVEHGLTMAADAHAETLYRLARRLGRLAGANEVMR